MGRLLAIDYGKKRTGLAATDPMKLIASPLEAVDTEKLWSFLKQYVPDEKVEAIIVGVPTDHKGEDTDITAECRKLMRELETFFPDVEVFSMDESFTSKMARESMVASGAKKKKRSVKKNVDKVSAALILQSFMEYKNY